MSNIFDLHTHTNQSDGCLSIEQLITHKKSAGVEVLSITDHDVITSALECEEILRDNSMSIIPGVEITSAWNITSLLHILGLNINSPSDQLADLLNDNRKIRLARAKIIDKKLAELGYPNSLNHIQEKYNPISLGRVHFARFLCDMRYVNNVSEAFRKILKNIVSGSVFEWPKLSTVISAIHSAGGKAIIAHPLRYGFDLKELKKLIKIFSQLGGDGVEFVSGNVAYKDVQLIKDLVEPYKLLASIGSDFHMPNTNKEFKAEKYSRWINNINPVWSEWGYS